MTHRLTLALCLMALPATVLPAAASQPGEYKTGPQTEHVAAPINLAPARPVSMAVMSYATFEATVNHADLAECPPAMAQPGRFCRLVLHGEALHVFAFSEDGDQPMQAVMELPVDSLQFAAP